MLSKVRSRRPSHATVVSYIALFIALGGTSAYAINEWNGSNIQDGTLTGADIQDLSLGLPDYGANSISTGKLKDQDVRTQDLRDLGVTNPKLAWDSVSSGKVINNNLSADDLGPAAVDTSELRDGAVGRELFSQRIPSGQTIGGAFAETGGDSFAAREAISFLVRPPSQPTVSSATAVGNVPADASCSGTFAQPIAPPGKLCLYWNETSQVSSLAFLHTQRGLIIEAFPSGPTPRIEGSWAYTAP
jgi:hypothetical protein